jgi:hypothetical protein
MPSQSVLPDRLARLGAGTLLLALVAAALEICLAPEAAHGPTSPLAALLVLLLLGVPAARIGLDGLAAWPRPARVACRRHGARPPRR